MKTAISVPDGVFERAEQVAHRHGLNRSQFYANAAARYADELEADDLTATIDEVVDLVNGDDSAQFASALGRRTLDEADDQW